ncbi:hypothetical protein FB567DRAFT_226367 [Paraphoma chrysanthemicola]|uniref:Uncharacterized protein n=1 Tax=Paraphoma chrysanthemicola TaxID=798071 RepID=A0A8K0W2D8_9PLEO|nr:hypothetical protein FB567DRAFT_226367 [Paraphoma chrysanthemicola]
MLNTSKDGIGYHCEMHKASRGSVCPSGVANLVCPIKEFYFFNAGYVLRLEVVLEYNCDKMPAICMNAQNWMSSAAATWPGRQPNVFTWDLGHNNEVIPGLPATNSQVRRSRQCPSNWKGTVAAPRCPEPNQPRVVPPLWDANGVGVTALKTPPVNPLTGAFELRIADGRDNQFAGALQESGRIYTCDEFPPASWVEGGVGTAGENNPEGDGKHLITLNQT